MNTTALSSLSDTEALLNRHAVRRTAGVPTVSLLVGPIGAGGRTWHRWASAVGRKVIVAKDGHFPSAEWVQSVAEQIDLPTMTVQCLAQRAGRDLNEFHAAWRAKTPADRERFWSTVAPNPDDALLRAVASLASGPDSGSTAAALRDLGEPLISVILRLAPTVLWPSALFIAASTEVFSAVGPVAVQWAERAPTIPIAVAVPVNVWDDFLTAAPETRTKALLREGEFRVPVLDAATVKRTLEEAGVAESVAAALGENGADAALVESAVSAQQAINTPPTTEAEEGRARSAAERFLFEFLESLPETVGRFELNVSLDFHFGKRLAEVDLLCRSQKIVLELDGYFHFLSNEGYRRDRKKDWELQRRGYLVLRFLSEDVISQLETIRDRILDALTNTPIGANP